MAVLATMPDRLSKLEAVCRQGKWLCSTMSISHPECQCQVCSTQQHQCIPLQQAVLQWCVSTECGLRSAARTTLSGHSISQPQSTNRMSSCFHLFKVAALLEPCALLLLMVVICWPVSFTPF